MGLFFFYVVLPTILHPLILGAAIAAFISGVVRLDGRFVAAGIVGVFVVRLVLDLVWGSGQRLGGITLASLSAGFVLVCYALHPRDTSAYRRREWTQ